MACTSWVYILSFSEVSRSRSEMRNATADISLVAVLGFSTISLSKATRLSTAHRLSTAQLLEETQT